MLLIKTEKLDRTFKKSKFKKTKDYNVINVCNDKDLKNLLKYGNELDVLREEYEKKKKELSEKRDSYAENFYFKYVGRVCIIEGQEYVLVNKWGGYLKFRRINKIQKWLLTDSARDYNKGFERITFTEEIFVLRNLQSRKPLVDEQQYFVKDSHYMFYKANSLDEYMWLYHGRYREDLEKSRRKILRLRNAR